MTDSRIKCHTFKSCAFLLLILDWDDEVWKVVGRLLLGGTDIPAPALFPSLILHAYVYYGVLFLGTEDRGTGTGIENLHLLF